MVLVNSDRDENDISDFHQNNSSSQRPMVHNDDPNNFIRSPYSHTNQDSISMHRQDAAVACLGANDSAAVHR